MNQIANILAAALLGCLFAMLVAPVATAPDHEYPDARAVSGDRVAARIGPGPAEWPCGWNRHSLRPILGNELSA